MYSWVCWLVSSLHSALFRYELALLVQYSIRGQYYRELWWCVLHSSQIAWWGEGCPVMYRLWWGRLPALQASGWYIPHTRACWLQGTAIPAVLCDWEWVAYSVSRSSSVQQVYVRQAPEQGIIRVVCLAEMQPVLHCGRSGSCNDSGKLLLCNMVLAGGVGEHKLRSPHGALSVMSCHCCQHLVLLLLASISPALAKGEAMHDNFNGSGGW